MATGIISIALLLISAVMAVVALASRPLHIVPRTGITLAMIRRGIGGIRISRGQIGHFIRWLVPVIAAAFVGAYIKSLL